MAASHRAKPAPPVAELDHRRAEHSQEIDSIDKAIAEAARIVNARPSWSFETDHLAWFCWEWQVRLGREVKAEGRSWRKGLAYGRRQFAYLQLSDSPVTRWERLRKRSSR